MNYIDITLPLEHKNLLTYPGDPEFECDHRYVATPGNPASYNASVLTLFTHGGTHIDPPLHFVKGGQGVDKIDLNVLCGPAHVIAIDDQVKEISEEVLRPLVHNDMKRILFKTANSKLLPTTRTRDYVHLVPDGARYLRQIGTIQLVGIDYISIETEDPPNFPVHNELLVKDPPIYILEGIDLRNVKPGQYELRCLPLRLKDGDGGPARAILIKL